MTDSDAELRIRWEWEPGQMVRAPEHAATWARIEISVGPDCLTLVEDRDSGSSRRSILCRCILWRNGWSTTGGSCYTIPDRPDLDLLDSPWVAATRTA